MVVVVVVQEQDMNTQRQAGQAGQAGRQAGGQAGRQATIPVQASPVDRDKTGDRSETEQHTVSACTLLFLTRPIEVLLTDLADC